jgi:PAS domain S-box-containing protein
MRDVSLPLRHSSLGDSAYAMFPPPEAPSPDDPSEERYQLALRAANDIIWDWDARTDASVWGGAMHAVLGHDPEDAACAPEGAYAWWSSHVHAEDRARVVAAYTEALESGATEWEAEYRFLRADGSYATIVDRACIGRDPTGAVTRVVGAMRDVSELARREAEQRRLAAAAVEARATAERTLDRMRRLQAITAALGTARTEAEVADVIVSRASDALGAAGGLLALRRHGAVGGVAVGTSTFELVRWVGYPEEIATWWRTFPLDSPTPLAFVGRTGTPVFFRSLEERAARFPEFSPSAAVTFTSAAIVPIIGADGESHGALGLSFATPQQFPAEDREFLASVAQQCAQALARARLYDAERVARAEAERANRAKMDFLAAMSHELRTPLNAIGGYAELLEMGIRGPVTAEQEEDLRRIRRSQRHLLSLINDVLNFAKIEAGTVPLRQAPVPLEPLLGSLDPMIAPQLEAKGITLARECADPSLAALGDEDKVRQILLNLIANAVKFTPAGGHVRMTAERDGALVLLRVRDTGVGIAPQHLERIFDPFVQVDRGATATEGTGLGLAISRDLARAMHGDLTAESTLGAGSTFTLALPKA